MITWDLAIEAPFGEARFGTRRMFESPHLVVQWFGFRRGQQLPRHKTSSTAVIQVLTGRMAVQVEGATRNYAAGQTVVLAPDQEHSLTALEDSVVQLLITPHPHNHSLGAALDLPTENAERGG